MANFNIFSIFSKKRNEIFYEYFQESAETCKQAAALFLRILENGVTDDEMISARQYKHKSNKIFRKTLKVLNQSKSTPIDRDDIQIISSMLNKITKKIVKACMNYRVYRIAEATEHMKMQAHTLISSTEELGYIMANFKRNTSVSEITDRNLKMKEIETRGDEIHYMALDALFSGQFDALTVIKFRDIHKDIESALDTCYGVSDVVTNTVLKDE